MGRINSCILYLLIFSTSSLLVLCIEHIERNNNRISRRILQMFFLLLAILIPCIFAGLRADSVGADTKGYAVLGFEYICSYSSIKSVFLNQEPLFYLLGYIVAKFSTNVSNFLFLIHTFIMAPIAIVAWKMRKRVSMTLFWLLFLVRFYNYSLCIMRQSIACSFLILGYCFLKEKKYIATIICFVLSMGFHNSAIIGCITILIIFIIEHSIFRKKKVINVFFSISIVMIFVSMGFGQLVLFLSKIGLVSPIYIERFYDLLFSQSNGYSNYLLYECFFRFIYIVGIIFIARMEERWCKSSWNDISLIAFLGNIVYITMALVYHKSTIYRLTEYFDYFNILYLCKLNDYFSIKYANTKLTNIFLVLLFIIYWLLTYIIFPEGIGFETEIFRFR